MSIPGRTVSDNKKFILGQRKKQCGCSGKIMLLKSILDGEIVTNEYIQLHKKISRKSKTSKSEAKRKHQMNGKEEIWEGICSNKALEIVDKIFKEKLLECRRFEKKIRKTVSKALLDLESRISK